MITIKGDYNEAIALSDFIEDEAINQIKTLCDQEFTQDLKIRIMPDVHAGTGLIVLLRKKF